MDYKMKLQKSNAEKFNKIIDEFEMPSYISDFLKLILNVRMSRYNIGQ